MIKYCLGGDVMKRNQAIDILKLVFAVSIIGIHTQIFLNTNSILRAFIPQGLFRIGVPFFFITAGYYYYRKVNDEQHNKDYLNRLVKLFIIFEGIEILLYTPFSLWRLQGFGIIAYIWNIFATGLGGAYWYITSTLLSLLILTPLWKKKKIEPLLFFGLILYLIVATNDSYSAIFAGTFIQNIAKVHTFIWIWPQAGLCSSLFWLSLGAYIREKPPKIKKLKPILIISTISLLIEAYLLQINGASDANCYISLIICVPALFLYCIENPIYTRYKYIGKMSLYVYMVHPIVLQILRFISPIFNSQYELLFVAASVITVLISYVFSKKVNSF